MTKICYLDYDGVLHDCQVFNSPGIGIHIRTPGRTLFEWAPILDELLAPHPDVEIVLSTSWVAAQSFEFARAQLPPGLQQRVIGSTYNTDNLRYFDAWPRGRQVASDVLERKPDSWFAIDDDDNGWPRNCRGRLIKTHGSAGISAPTAQDAIRKILLSL
jgi:hypothetical protein